MSSYVIEEQTSAGWHRRQKFDTVDFLLNREPADSQIWSLMRWYQSGSVDIPEQFSFLDVSEIDPRRYTFRQHNGHAFGKLDGIQFKDYPIPDHARACGHEYSNCKDDGIPHAHYINQEMCGVSREYFRLMVPVVIRQKVVAIAYAFRHQQPVLPAIRV